MNETVTRQKIRTWMNRQRTLGTPSPAYLEWLRKQFVLHCEATVTRKKPNENTDANL
jgi:hypothetical protein